IFALFTLSVNYNDPPGLQGCKQHQQTQIVSASEGPFKGGFKKKKEKRAVLETQRKELNDELRQEQEKRTELENVAVGFKRIEREMATPRLTCRSDAEGAVWEPKRSRATPSRTKAAPVVGQHRIGFPTCVLAVPARSKRARGVGKEKPGPRTVVPPVSSDNSPARDHVTTFLHSAISMAKGGKSRPGPAIPIRLCPRPLPASGGGSQ
ncbi:hypothetical protein HPB47_000604, partial [Ixodes persulcatus]